jgi:hypothetical protein
MFHRDPLSPEIGMIRDEWCDLTGNLARLGGRFRSRSDATQPPKFLPCQVRPARYHEQMAEIACGRTVPLITMSRFLTVLQGV